MTALKRIFAPWKSDSSAYCNRKPEAQMRAKSLRALSLSIISVIVMSAVAEPQQAYAESRWGGMQFGPDTIADIAAEVAPAVVNLVASQTVARDSLGRLKEQTRNQADANKKIRRYYGIDAPRAPEPETLKVTGTGVIVSPDGYILTSLHVVENGGAVNVTCLDGRTFTANVVAKDRFSDLAVLKCANASGLQTVKFANSDGLRPGDWVIAIGNPFGYGHTVTHGLISGLGREAKGFEKSFGARTGAVKFIQTDAPINFGSSGGPLVNLKGEVVGINTFIRDDANNIGFAIPSNVAKEVSDKLMKTGQIAHPYIGITMKDQHLNPGAGVEVAEVKFRSPAAMAGILPGDIIMVVDGNPAGKPEDISNSVSKHKVGELVHMKVQRNAVDKEFDVKIEPLPEEGD
jgi:serine protease Do